MNLDTVVRQTGDNPKAVIIWLHGLGADGNDFVPVVPEFSIKDFPVKFVFPHAPKIPVTINGGMVMRAWYDILAMDIDRHIDENGINGSVNLINKLIDEQISQGFNYDQIILAGFSQGAAMSLHISTQSPHNFAGVIALSGYLPVPEQIIDNANSSNHNTPYFMGHGTQDPVVPYQLGKTSSETMIKAGYTISWHQYPIQHGVSMEELSDINQWIINKIKK